MSPRTNRPIIPPHWSPEQVGAVYEFLSQLTDRIWADYQDHLIEQLGALTERYDYPDGAETDPRQISLFEIGESDFNDDLPF